MSRRLLILLAASTAAAPAFAQQDPVPTPPIVPPAPSSAAATSPAIIVEKSTREAVVQADGTFVTTQSTVFRIARPDAVRAASTVPIPVSSSLQRFELIEAYTETPDGKKLPVSPDSIITQKKE